MRITLTCLLALMTGVLTLWSCQKEISFEDNGGTLGGSNNGNPGWSFSTSNANYHGCIDTAYYETISGMNTLTIEGTDSAANEFSISLISQTPLTATTYTVAQGALMAYTNSSGNSYVSSSPSSFSIKISSINDSLIVASFTASLSDPFGGGAFTITNGTLKALIGRHNSCGISGSGGTTGGGTGGNTGGSSTTFSLDNCSNANLQGTYLRDTTLTSANKVTLDVTVTTPGPWSVSTNTVNGFKFSGSGTFSTTGPQTITLQGTGKPIAYGNTDFPITSGSSSCNFSVLVDTIGVAPCNPANNTITFTTAGIGPISLYGTTTTTGGGSYQIVGNGQGGDITLEFAGTTQPKPGVYTIQGLGGSFLTGDVRVSLVSSSIYWQSNTGKVYVSIANGKVVATFCSVSFSGSLGGPTYTTLASGKVTEE